MPAHYLFRMNTREVQALAPKTNIALLPIGPTEVHSLHLPLGTDVESALEVCERTSAKLQAMGLDCLIASPINYALADVANCFCGNTTLRPETVAAIVEDVCTSLAKWGFTHIMIMCGHAEPRNIEALQEGANRAMERDTRIFARVSNWLLGSNIACAMRCAHPEAVRTRSGTYTLARARQRSCSCATRTLWTGTSCRPLSPTGRASSSRLALPKAGTSWAVEQRRPTLAIPAQAVPRQAKGSTISTRTLPWQRS